MTYPHPPKLLDQVRDVLRRRHYSPRTEETYIGWTRRFIIFHGKRHPREMGAVEITVREGKRNKDRRTVLPKRVVDPLRLHLDKVGRLHARDLAAGHGLVPLPDALDRKPPSANRGGLAIRSPLDG